MHCFTFFHLTWLPRQAFILGIASRYLLFVLTLYISFLTVVTSVLYHLSIALSLTFLVLLNLNLPLPVFHPLLSSSFHPSSLLILSSLFYNSFYPSSLLIQSFRLLILPSFPSSLFIRLSAFADEVQGLDQYAIRKFGEAFDVVPRTLAENSGGEEHTMNISFFYNLLYLLIP